jgi:hypothetical protein
LRSGAGRKPRVGLKQPSRLGSVFSFGIRATFEDANDELRSRYGRGTTT